MVWVLCVSRIVYIIDCVYHGLCVSWIVCVMDCVYHGLCVSQSSMPTSHCESVANTSGCMLQCLFIFCVQGVLANKDNSL